jgi:hypothetical protein
MAPLVFHEVRRTLRPGLVLALVGFCMVLIYERVGEPWMAAYAQVQGALSVHASWLMIAVPVLAGAVGASLARERHEGVTLLLLARGVSRRRYLLAKTLGAAASGALLMSAAIVAFYVIVGILWPAGEVTFGRNASTIGPVPALYAAYPLANDLVLAGMNVVATAAWSLLGVLTGTLTANRYVAMAVPLVFFVVILVLESFWSKTLWMPSTYLYLADYYQYAVPAAYQPYAAFVYWLGFGAAVAALSRWLFLRSELR